MWCPNMYFNEIPWMKTCALVFPPKSDNCMCSPCVEIKDYFIAYFWRIATFKGAYHWTSAKGRTHIHFRGAWISWYIYEAPMSPTLSRSSAIQCFVCSNALEVLNFEVKLKHWVRQNQIKIDEAEIDETGVEITSVYMYMYISLFWSSCEACAIRYMY